MNIKINFIHVLLLLFAIFVCAGALNDLKYYEFEYFNLQELCLSALIFFAFFVLGILLIAVDRLYEKFHENDQLMEKEIQKDIDFTRKVYEYLRGYQSMINELKQQLLDIQNKK